MTAAELAAALKAARLAARLSQTEVGRRIGSPASTVSRWEHGELTIGIASARAYAEACGVPFTLALGEPPPPQPPPIERPTADDLAALVSVASTLSRADLLALLALARHFGGRS